MNETSPSRNSELLKSVPAFENLTSADIEKIAERTELKRVQRGEALLKQGGKADSLYLVLRGRFTVIASGAAIAEISIGEPIGEVAFFAGGTRTADVVAARDSEVMMLTRSTYDELSAELPELGRNILESIAARLAKNTLATPKLRPRSGKMVAIVSVDEQVDRQKINQQLASVISANPDCTLIFEVPEEVGPTPSDLALWMETIEKTSSSVVFNCATQNFDEAQIEFIANNCDTIYFLGRQQSDNEQNVPLSNVEKSLVATTLPSNLHLVIVRDKSEDRIQNTKAWLAQRDVAMHHHVALDSPDDFARLLRFIQGRAMGVVLCGGGAFGTAHLGAIKALKEHGHAIDMIGGTSVGAAIAAALAMEYSPDQALEVCEEIFLKHKAMSRLNVPLYSVLDHGPLDTQLRQQFDDIRIEDLPISYFAVATSLTKNDMHVARSGLLWKKIRASSSIPAVFPPMVSDEGEVFIDGAMIDNVPIAVMRDLKSGPNLVLNFKQRKEWWINAKYDELPGRLGSLKRMIWRTRGKGKFPSIFSILTRSMVVSSRRLLEQTAMDGDVLLEISTMRGMGFLDWTKGRQLFEIAYEEMSEALTATESNAAGDKMAQLASVAEIINGEFE